MAFFFLFIKGKWSVGNPWVGGCTNAGCYFAVNAPRRAICPIYLYLTFAQIDSLASVVILLPDLTIKLYVELYVELNVDPVQSSS